MALRVIWKNESVFTSAPGMGEGLAFTVFASPVRAGKGQGGRPRKPGWGWDPAVPSAPGDGGWQQGVGPSMHFPTSCHTVGSCLTSVLQLGVRWLPGNFVVTTEKMYLNLKQPDMEDSKEKASEKELSTESPGVCGRAGSHGTPKQRLPESVCINSPGAC